MDGNEIFMPKKYDIIVNMKNNPESIAYCVKYEVSELIKFTKFLDE